MRSTEKISREIEPIDVGTLWTMRRGDHAARCALLSERGEWITRVLINGDVLLEERLASTDEAFRIAEQWRVRMIRQAWHQVLPAGWRRDERPEHQVGVDS